MNRYTLVTIALLALLSGCAAQPVELPTTVTLTEPVQYFGGTARQVESVTFDRQGEAKQKASTCVAIHIDNADVTLSDDAYMFLGTVSRTEEGGSTIEHVDSDSGLVVARGTAKFTKPSALKPSVRYLRYKLLALTEEGGETVLQFQNIQQALESTGGVQNDGFQPLGTWKGSGVTAAYSALEEEADKVLDCIYQGSAI